MRFLEGKISERIQLGLTDLSCFRTNVPLVAGLTEPPIGVTIGVTQLGSGLFCWHNTPVSGLDGLLLKSPLKCELRKDRQNRGHP
jgi:hypothetical protein